MHERIEEKLKKEEPTTEQEAVIVGGLRDKLDRLEGALPVNNVELTLEPNEDLSGVFGTLVLTPISGVRDEFQDVQEFEDAIRLQVSGVFPELRVEDLELDGFDQARVHFDI